MSRHHQKLDRRKWEAVRRRVLDRARWLCVKCGCYGNEVDHVRPLQHGGVDPYDVANLQPLCSACHRFKTRGENRRPRSPAELEWDQYVQEVANGSV